MSTTIEMSDYTVGSDAYREIPAVCAAQRMDKVVLIGGKRALGAAEPLIRAALEGSGVQILGSFVYGTECTQANADRLLAEPAVQQADVVFAVGGGKAIDTCKVAADLAHKPVFSFPTICSNCSAATAIAVVYDDSGAFSHYHYPPCPRHIFINPQVIAEAPEEYFWAGIGDALSKQPEVEYASSNAELGHTAQLGVALAKACTEPLIAFGAQGIADCRNNVVSEAVQEIALDIVVSTGYVSNLTNQPDFYYNSSIAHAFYNASTSVARPGTYLHGQVVSFGVLVLHAFTGNDAELDRIARFNRSIGLPVTLAEIGLTEDDLPQIAREATKTNEWKNLPYPTMTEQFIEAVKKADAYGQKVLAE